MVENVRTGEIVEFLVDTPELLQMEVTWTKPGARALRHAHPRMEIVLVAAEARDKR
jgi:hypothetical protein